MWRHNFYACKCSASLKSIISAKKKDALNFLWQFYHTRYFQKTKKIIQNKLDRLSSFMIFPNLQNTVTFRYVCACADIKPCIIQLNSDKTSVRMQFYTRNINGAAITWDASLSKLGQYQSEEEQWKSLPSRFHSCCSCLCLFLALAWTNYVKVG